MVQLQHAARGRKRDNIACAHGLKLACVRCVSSYHDKQYTDDGNRHLNGWKQKSQLSKGYTPAEKLAR
eukprot:11158028-Lingulodinium_polyedra.AAC.1